MREKEREGGGLKNKKIVETERIRIRKWKTHKTFKQTNKRTSAKICSFVCFLENFSLPFPAKMGKNFKKSNRNPYFAIIKFKYFNRKNELRLNID